MKTYTIAGGTTVADKGQPSLSDPEKIRPRSETFEDDAVSDAVSKPCMVSPTLAACQADTSLAISTGHIMCFYEKVVKVKADVAAMLNDDTLIDRQTDLS